MRCEPISLSLLGSSVSLGSDGPDGSFVLKVGSVRVAEPPAKVLVLPPPHAPRFAFVRGLFISPAFQDQSTPIVGQD